MQAGTDVVRDRQGGGAQTVALGGNVTAMVQLALGLSELGQ